MFSFLLMVPADARLMKLVSWEQENWSFHDAWFEFIQLLSDHGEQEAGHGRIFQEMDDWFFFFHLFDDVVPGFLIVLDLLPTFAFLSCQRSLPPFFRFCRVPELFPLFATSFSVTGWSRDGRTLRLVFAVRWHCFPFHFTHDLWNGRVVSNRGKQIGCRQTLDVRKAATNFSLSDLRVV